MDMFREYFTDKIVLCFGSQLGKTEAILNMMGYAIDQDPGAMLVVYPSETLAKSISKNRLQPMIEAVDALLSKWERMRSETLEIQFLGMSIALVGSNSPANLASRPVRYIFYDETDKFPSFSGREASPSELASERSKNYTGRKEIHASTPTLSSGHIWREYEGADAKKNFYVPCPHCNEMWTFKLKQIKWPAALNEEDRKSERANRVLTESWYECEFCGGKIHDMDKIRMLLAGEWRHVERDEEGNWAESRRLFKRPRTVGYNLSSIYSPWVTFGQVAQKFLQSKDDPAKYMNFVNSWLGEPWESRATKMRSDIVLDRQSEHERGTVPAEAQLITCGVDVQRDSFWWVVRAWGPKLTSWLVDFGNCETWGELDDVLDREYPQVGGQPMIVNIAFVDSGDQADEVYGYCSTRMGGVFPSKGASQRMTRAPLVESRVEKDDYGGMRLFILDTHYYKSFIAGRVRKETDSSGSFNVFKATTADEKAWLRAYAEQLCAEQLVMIRDGKGKETEVWRPVHSHPNNHLLDAECYGIAAAERAGVRYLKTE